jgi:hypothetical protein
MQVPDIVCGSEVVMRNLQRLQVQVVEPVNSFEQVVADIECIQLSKGRDVFNGRDAVLLQEQTT